MSEPRQNSSPHPNAAQRPSKRALLFALSVWALTRIFVVWHAYTNRGPLGDVYYYFAGVFGIDPSAMQEYPAPGVWPVQWVGILTGEHPPHFEFGVVALCLLFDAILVAALLASSSPGKIAGCWFWIVVSCLMPQMLLWRLDVIPGVLVALAGLALMRRPALGSTLLAVATSVKLWPGILAAGLVGRWNKAGTYIRVGSFLGALAAMCALVAFTDGPQRLLSPLSYQGGRGLQIESVAATPLIWQALRHPSDYSISYAASKSFEISGPGVTLAMTLSTVLMGLTLLGAACWGLRKLLKGHWEPNTTVVWMLLMIALLILSNKVLSPQYLLWLSPLLSVALARQPRTAWGWIAAVLLLAASQLTWMVYPRFYTDLIHVPFPGSAGALSLIARNITLVMFTIVLFGWLLTNAKRAKFSVDHSTTRHTASPASLANRRAQVVSVPKAGNTLNNEHPAASGTPSTLYSVKMRGSAEASHVCGAEDFSEDIPGAARLAAAQVERALRHPHGPSNEVFLHVQAVDPDAVITVPAVQVQAVPALASQASAEQVQQWMRVTLEGAGIAAAQEAVSTLYEIRGMRGAALVHAATGERLDPDHDRGVRASTFGSLHRPLVEKPSAPHAAQGPTLQKRYHEEAVTLASKVASAPGVLAELCLSDDPAYTTGYLCTGGVYYRIPNAKPSGSDHGGRVFVIAPGTDLPQLIAYLEDTPVLVEPARRMHGEQGASHA